MTSFPCLVCSGPTKLYRCNTKRGITRRTYQCQRCASYFRTWAHAGTGKGNGKTRATAESEPRLVVKAEHTESLWPKVTTSWDSLGLRNDAFR